MVSPCSLRVGGCMREEAGQTVGLPGMLSIVIGSIIGAGIFMLPVSLDRKSTRLNSSHLVISYAVFCLKKKKHFQRTPSDRDDPGCSAVLSFTYALAPVIATAPPEHVPTLPSATAQVSNLSCRTSASTQ